jgi:hypothetical protein
MNSNTKKIYKIGMAAYLLADYLSDYQLRDALRGYDFKKYIDRMREIKPELQLAGGVLVSIAKIEEKASQYCKRVDEAAYKSIKNDESMTAEERKAEADLFVSQFAKSSNLLDNWLDDMFDIGEDKFGEIGLLIEHAVEQVKGNRKTDIDLLLEWIASYPEGYTMSLQTVRNKAIHIKNRTT